MTDDRVDLIRQLRYLVPAAALLFSGAQGLLGHAHGMALSLALLEIAYGALLLRSMRESSARAAGADRIALPAAGVLAVEALQNEPPTALGLTPVLDAGTLQTAGDSQ